MFSYLVLALGGLLFGAMVYRYDMHEREPWWMLVLAAVGGALMMAGAFELELLIQDLAGASNQSVIKAMLAGTLEELGKLAIPITVALLVRKHFNDPMDGLIYGSLAGLGAGLFESLWWQIFDPVQNVLQENGAAFMRLFIHTIWGGIVGSALGLVVMKKAWRKILAKRVGLVMLIHFAWDYLVGFVPADEHNNWHRLFAALLLGTSIVWYGMLVVQANKWSRAMHAPKSKQRLAGKILRILITRRIR